MMTIQKPKRMWQKKKDYMRKKTIRGLRRKGKRILQSFDDGKDMSYQDWKTKAAKYKNLKIDEDNTFDYEGWYNSNPENAYRFLNDDPRAHFDDTYKTVYHPTFSDLSIYSGKIDPRFNPKGLKGGHWVNDHKYISPKETPISMDDRINYIIDGEDNGVQLRTFDNKPLWMDDGTRYEGQLPQVIVKPKRYKRGKDCFDIGTDDNEIPKHFWETEEEYQERLKNTDIKKYKLQQIEQKQRIAQMKKDRAVFLTTPEGQKRAKKIRDEDNAFTKNIKHSLKINQPNNISKITDSVVDSLKKVSNMRNNVQEAIDNQEQERKEHARQIKNIVDATLTVGELGLSGLSLLRAFGNYRNWKNGSRLARGVINLLNKNQLPMQVGGALIDGYQTYDNFQKGDYKNGIYNTLSLTGGIAGSIGASDIFRTSNMYNPKIDKYLDITGVTQNIGDYLKFGYDTYNNSR